MARIRHYLELIRLSHTIFALPFAILAAVMAWRYPPIVPFQWKTLLGILACMVTARSAAMAFNRLVDRRFDALNPRTASRHLPAGKLTVRQVVLFTTLSSAAFIGGTCLFLPENPIPLYTSVPVLLFLLSYSHAKRFTALAHWWLGAALMLAPWATWVAIRGEIWATPPILLGAAVMCWVGGFDIIYACQDAAFDRSAKLHSVPARWGVTGALRIAAASHAVMIALLAALPCFYPAFGAIYLTAIGLIALLLIYEHWLVSPDDLSRAGRAFFHVNAIVSIGLSAVAIVDILI